MILENGAPLMATTAPPRTIAFHLATARNALVEARRLALADAADATYQLAQGRFRPLTDAAGTVARVDDLLHMTTRLLESHGS